MKENEQADTRVYWIDGVCIHDGRCWTTELVDVEPGGSELRRWDVHPLCLGNEADIVPVLKRKESIPNDLSPRIKAAIEEILEVEYEPAPGGRGFHRNSANRSVRRQQRTARRTQAH